MSNFSARTKNPHTGKWEQANWLDNHFGHHNYGVEFPDGHIYDIRYWDLKTLNPNQVEVKILKGEEANRYYEKRVDEINELGVEI